MIYIPEGDLHESAKINAIYSKIHLLESYQKVWVALASAQAELGIIPKEAADEISALADIKNVDIPYYDEQVTITGGQQIVSLIRAWKPSFKGSKSAEFIHYGATTQDIMDTAEILKFREVYNIIYKELRELENVLKNMAEEHINTPIAGRTHGQHAVPITFGLKVAIWLMEIKRHIERMEECSKRLFVGSFYGAAGNLASLSGGGLKITELMSKKLGLGFVAVPWHTTHDNIVEFMTLLCNIVTSAGRVASEIFELNRTEIGEVEEPWTYGNVSSSTMPQKRNPEGCEAVVSLARLVQFEVGAVYQSNMHENERDSRSWNIDQFVFPITCGMVEKSLRYMILILKGLVVLPDKMRTNLEMTNGLIMSESIMMTLGKKIGRLNAHEKIYHMAIEAHENNIHLKELVLADKEIMNKCNKEEIETAFEPLSYVGDSYKMTRAAIDAVK